MVQWLRPLVRRNIRAPDNSLWSQTTKTQSGPLDSILSYNYFEQFTVNSTCPIIFSSPIQVPKHNHLILFEHRFDKFEDFCWVSDKKYPLFLVSTMRRRVLKNHTIYLVLRSALCGYFGGPPLGNTCTAGQIMIILALCRYF